MILRVDNRGYSLTLIKDINTFLCGCARGWLRVCAFSSAKNVWFPRSARWSKHGQPQESSLLAPALSHDISGFWRAFVGAVGVSVCLRPAAAAHRPNFSGQGPRARSRMPRPGWMEKFQGGPLWRAIGCYVPAFGEAILHSEGHGRRNGPVWWLGSRKVRFSSPDPVCVRFRVMSVLVVTYLS